MAALMWKVRPGSRKSWRWCRPSTSFSCCTLQCRTQFAHNHPQPESCRSSFPTPTASSPAHSWQIIFHLHGPPTPTPYPRLPALAPAQRQIGRL